MYSAQIAKLAGKLGLPLIDVRSRFLDRRDIDSLIARDGIHLTEPGYPAAAGRVPPHSGGAGVKTSYKKGCCRCNTPF